MSHEGTFGKQMLNTRELALVDEITHRAVTLLEEFDNPQPRWRLFLLIATAHRVLPLDLEAMTTGRVQDFAHDIGGMMRHLNVRERRWEDCFTPRFTKREPVILTGDFHG